MVDDNRPSILTCENEESTGSRVFGGFGRSLKSFKSIDSGHLRRPQATNDEMVSPFPPSQGALPATVHPS